MGKTYHRLKVKCEAEGRSVSGFLEDLIAPHIEGIELPTSPPPPRPMVREPSNDPAHDIERMRAIDEAFGPRFSG